MNAKAALVELDKLPAPDCRRAAYLDYYRDSRRQMRLWAKKWRNCRAGIFLELAQEHRGWSLHWLNKLREVAP